MPPRIRVLSIAHTAVDRRAGRLRYHPLADRADLDVHLVVPAQWHQYGRSLTADPPDDPAVTVHVLRTILGKAGPAGWYLHLYPGLRRLIRQLRPDVIHLWEEPWSFVALQAWLLKENAALVLEVDQNVLRRLPPPFEAIRRFVLPRTDHILSRSTGATAVVQASGYKGGVTPIGYGVDTAIFRPEPRTERREAPLRIGYVGRLVHEKGLDDVLDALVAASAPVALSIMGEGPHEMHLRRRTRELGLEDRVSFAPWTSPSGVVAFLRSLDALVLVTRSVKVYQEQFGRVIIEAQACGVPVIGSDCGAIPDVVGEGGWIVPERRPLALAALLDRIAEKTAERSTRSTAALDNVRHRFTYEATADALARSWVAAVAARRHPHEEEIQVVEVVSEFGVGGGSERVAWNVAHALAGEGFPTSVITSRISDPPLVPIDTRVVAPGLSRIPTRGRSRYLGRALVIPLFTLAATLSLRRDSHRVVISHGDSFRGDIVVVHAVNAASLNEKRRVHSWRWRLNPLHLWVSFRDRVMMGGLRYRYYVALSQRIVSELQQIYRVPRERIVVIPNGVDIDRFQPNPTRGSLMRERLGIPSDAKVLLFVGHEFERKGLTYVLDALTRLDRSYRLIVVGSEAPDPYLSLAGARTADVTFAGPQADIAPFYMAADAFILPSLYEAFPMVCMEALASGLPLFATQVGGVEDYLVDGANGYLVLRDGADIASKVAHAFADKEHWARLQVGARETALRYSLERSGRAYASLVRRVATEKRGYPQSRTDRADHTSQPKSNQT